MSVESRLDNCLKDLSELTEKVERLESNLNSSVGDSETVRRVEEDCRRLGIRSARLKRVPSDYYSRSLEERRDLVGAVSTHHLCKSILLENTSCTESDCSDPLNSRFYIVIIQYTAKLHSHKVFGYVRSLSKLPRKMYHFRLADESESAELTGFEHNAMSPIGLKQKNIPIIMDEKITRLHPNFFWAGGGEVDLKLGMSIEEFTSSVPLLHVADITH